MSLCHGTWDFLKLRNPTRCSRLCAEHLTPCPVLRNCPYVLVESNWGPRIWTQGTQEPGRDLPFLSSFLPCGCFGFWQSSFCKKKKKKAWAFQDQRIEHLSKRTSRPECWMFTPANSKCFSWQPLSKVGNAFIVNLVLSHLDCVQSKNLDKYRKPKKVCTLLRPVAINYFK